ncbi:hypothetical protein [Corynebacterium diphtheriae]|nr:hypothetical protein [Corynebacterium diphtheriae]MCM0017466.1 hypothetical protein [Corynebacterium diphtheriae bv. mitis]MCM0076994.1 hypothetical protein [Corynebacterium diphtheriae bv. mitis]MCM0092286.1 hypothetical protein [Corynebacterium diphtheriae]MCM0124527.1 hypothetical protein [Corynebacterium diphtheriae bv. mitis]MCM0146244.1 hypothetical protein [Corynebacterium diphtheriae]
MWASGALNIDGAEHVRKSFERFGLVPSSDVKPALQLPKTVAGQDFLK